MVPFDIYWIKKSGKKTKIISHGSVLSRTELGRWTQKEINLELKNIYDLEFMQEGFELLCELESISKDKFNSVKNIPLWRTKFISWLFEKKDNKDRVNKPFELSCLFGFFFGLLPEALEKPFSTCPDNIQSKNLAGAAAAVSLAILVGYQDLSFLKEFYKVFIFMDYPFCEKVPSEQDSNDLRKIKSKIAEKSTVNRIHDLYRTHVSEGIKLLEEGLEFKSLANYLNWPFERFNGDGLLLNINQREISDLDSVVIYCHSIFSFEVVRIESEIEICNLDQLMSREDGSYYHRLAGFLKCRLKKNEEDSEYLAIVGL